MKLTDTLICKAAALAKSVTGFFVKRPCGDLRSVVLLATFFPAAVLADLQAQKADFESASMSVSSGTRNAAFGAAAPSADARLLVNWVAKTHDSNGTPFVVIDKRLAVLYLFDGQARLLATSPVLLGSALGDHTVPGIGDRPIAQVRPEERTTPAGRFVAERGRNARGEDVVWVDYDAAVSMHRVVTSNRAERRLERLDSPTAGDNRISFGCINLPVSFYESYIRPAFARQSGIIYILPEVATVEQVFGIQVGPSSRLNASR